MDIFERYEESLTAYNRAAGLIGRGNIDEAEPLLREALASYPRQVLMDGEPEADDEVRETLDALFENIRSKLIEIDRQRASHSDASDTGSGTLQSIVDRNVFGRQSPEPGAVTHKEETSFDVVPDESPEIQPSPPPEDVLEFEVEEAPPVEILEADDPAAGEGASEEPAAAPEDEAPGWEVEESLPEEAILRGEEPAAAPEPEPVAEAAPPPVEKAASRDIEVEDLLQSVDSIRETGDVVSEDDYQVSDEVFLDGPIDEDEDDEDEEIFEPLPEHIDEPCEEDREGAAFTWSEEDEEVILKASGQGPAGSFLGGLIEKIKSFFVRKETAERVEEFPPEREQEPGPDAEPPGERQAGVEEAAPEVWEPPPEGKTGLSAEEETKGTDMEQDMESPEAEEEEQQQEEAPPPEAEPPEAAAPVGEEEVLPEEEAAGDDEELTPAEEILIKEREKETEGKSSRKVGFLAGAASIFSIRIGGGTSVRRKGKAGIFSLSVSVPSLVIVLLGMGAVLAVVSVYPVYNKAALLSRIDGAFERGDVGAAASGYVRLAKETSDPDTLEFISAGAAARARAMIARGEASDAVGMLRLLLNEAVADERLRTLLADAYATKAIAIAESGDLETARGMAGLVETEVELLRGEVPAHVSGKYARLQTLIKENNLNN